MRLEIRARRLVVVGWLLSLPAACGTGTDCTCSVEYNTERRTLVCGQTSCVGGTSVSCIEKDDSVRRGACSAPPPPPSSENGNPRPDTTPPLPDRSCEDLLVFCNTSCGSPVSISASCLATASSGDTAACAVWPLTNGVLCRP